MNRTKFNITEQLKELMRDIKDTYNFDFNDYKTLNTLFECVRGDLENNLGKMSKSDFFALCCLILSDIEDVEDWNDVSYNLADSVKTSFYVEEKGVKCCCGKSIKKVVILTLVNGDSLLTGNSCCKKDDIVSKEELKEINSNQRKMKNYNKCIKCNEYAIEKDSDKCMCNKCEDKINRELKKEMRLNSKCKNCKVCNKKIKLKQYKYGKKCYDCNMKK